MTAVLSPPAPPARAAAPDRASARAFVDEHVRPHADDWERCGRVPEDVLAEVTAAGLWAPFLPVAAGGAGVDMLTLAALHEEVGRGCSSLRSLLTVHTMLTWALHRWGSPVQLDRWGRGVASGTLPGAFCLSEPGAGSDAAGITTTAAAQPDGGWVLDGCKTWTTGGQRAGLLLVFARTDTGTVALLVPTDLPGVTIRPIDGMLGTSASLIAHIEFAGVRLDEHALLGPRAFASGMVLTGTLDLGRLSVAAGSVGIIQGCLDACASYADVRTVGGRKLRELDLIRAKLADMVTDVRAARLLVAEAARLKDAGDPATIMATWAAKYFASTAAARHAAEAVQVHGAAGCSPQFPVARFYRDAKIMEIIEGSTELQRLALADEAYRESR